MVREGSWITLVLGGILFAVIGYLHRRFDPLGQRARARKEIAASSRNPWLWEMQLAHAPLMVVIGAIMVVIGLIWGVVSLFQ